MSAKPFPKGAGVKFGWDKETQMSTASFDIGTDLTRTCEVEINGIKFTRGPLHPFNATIEPWTPNANAVRAVDQAIAIARLMPAGEKRARFLDSVASVWQANNCILYSVTTEASE